MTQWTASNSDYKKILNEQNAAYYEQVLLRTRSRSKATTKQTENALSKVLQYIEEQQQMGVNVEQLYSVSPDVLSEQILNELPKQRVINRAVYIGQLVLQFLAAYVLMTGGINLVLRQSMTLFAGSLIVQATISITAFIALILFILRMLHKGKKAIFIMASSVSLFIFIVAWGVLQIPAFGPSIEIQPLLLIFVGACMLVGAKVLAKRL